MNLFQKRSTDQVVIHTDGACNPNPGPGGWAAIIEIGGQEKVISGGESYTTNNRMELMAALHALKKQKSNSHIIINTDSEYLHKGVTEWLPGWKSRNWKRRGGALANIDLWQELDLELSRHTVQWKWVKGHDGNRQNHKADRLARQAIPR